MRLFNWRRQILHAMPVVKPDQIRTPWRREFWRRFRRQHVACWSPGTVLALPWWRFCPLLTPYDAETILTTIARTMAPLAALVWR